MRSPTRFICLLAIPAFSNAFSIAPIFSSVAASSPRAETVRYAMPKTVAVTGATGRTGSLVVEELLGRGINVVALVRDMQKAKDTLPSVEGDTSLKIVQCDLGSAKEIIASVNGCDAAIWCATGFSDNPSQSFLDKIKGVFGVALSPKTSIDAVGIPALAKAFEAGAVNRLAMQAAFDMIDTDSSGSISMSEMKVFLATASQFSMRPDEIDLIMQNGDVNGDGELDFQEFKRLMTFDLAPKIVMLSSAGVTRPSWSDEKKKMFEGCADIPIVRLNPFGILGIKADSEERLRQSGE